MANVVRSEGSAWSNDLTVAATRRHHLDSPVTSGSASVLQVARDTVGLHSTLPGTPYLSLHARIDAFTTDDLETEVYDRRSLVRLKVMRGTVFLLTHDLAQIAFAATSEVTLERDRRWLRVRRRVLDLVAETGEFWFGQSIPVREYAQMVPLGQQTGVMRKPLDGATPVA